MQQYTTRRHFLQAGSTAAVGAMVPGWIDTSRPLPSFPWRGEDGRAAPAGVDDPLFRDLAQQAVDAAKQAGAAYADARITRTLQSRWKDGFVREEQTLAFGVRALVHGYWGFASGPYCTTDEARRLAQEAVSQASINARGKERLVHLAPVAPVSGTWSHPIQIDPFTVPIEEVADFASTWTPESIQYQSPNFSRYEFWLFRTEKTCASTDGNLFTQHLYLTGGKFSVNGASVSLPSASAGWEYIQDAKVFDQIPRLRDEARRTRLTGRVPVEIGRYPMVFDARVMASLMAATIGPATQLDRALGYEANAAGTSFLNRPLELLGEHQLASPLVNIVADRTMRYGAATVQWDDEGVPAAAFPIVTNGRLADFQTTRESAAWLSPYYEKIGQSVQSRGCMDVRFALDLPMQHTPNLILQPGTDTLTFDEMVSQVRKGYAVFGADFKADFQLRYGSGSISAREINNGQLGAFVQDAGILFDTEGLWKNIKALGGPRTLARAFGESVKGEPKQDAWFSVEAVPAFIHDVSLIDVKRKA